MICFLQDEGQKACKDQKHQHAHDMDRGRGQPRTIPFRRQAASRIFRNTQRLPSFWGSGPQVMFRRSGLPFKGPSLRQFDGGMRERSG